MFVRDDRFWRGKDLAVCVLMRFRNLYCFVLSVGDPATCAFSC
jgi:hypothetical protein